MEAEVGFSWGNRVAIWIEQAWLVSHLAKTRNGGVKFALDLATSKGASDATEVHHEKSFATLRANVDDFALEASPFFCNYIFNFNHTFIMTEIGKMASFFFSIKFFVHKYLFTNKIRM